MSTKANEIAAMTRLLYECVDQLAEHMPRATSDSLGPEVRRSALREVRLAVAMGGIAFQSLAVDANVPIFVLGDAARAIRVATDCLRRLEGVPDSEWLHEEAKRRFPEDEQATLRSVWLSGVGFGQGRTP